MRGGPGRGRGENGDAGGQHAVGKEVAAEVVHHLDLMGETGWVGGGEMMRVGEAKEFANEEDGGLQTKKKPLRFAFKNARNEAARRGVGGRFKNWNIRA